MMEDFSFYWSEIFKSKLGEIIQEDQQVKCQKGSENRVRTRMNFGWFLWHDVTRGVAALPV